MPAGAQTHGSRGVASYREFADALVEVGLIDAAQLKRYTAKSPEDVLGLSRALVKAGWLTPYQAAAIYQKKGRGLLVGNYLILEKLGQGGMGMVFKARHRELGRLGALKILPPSFTRDRGAVMRFRREFELAGQLRHLNLVAAFEADEDRGVHYLVMDYVRGITLDRLVVEQGPLPVAEAVDYLIQAARGLEAAHEKGIVHRDIKPGNLMLDSRGTVRVLDLGLARIVNAESTLGSSSASRLTQTGIYMGTVDFMAPEQAEDSHNVDHRADIYSLGCTLHFLLTGREPFPGPTIFRRMVAHQEHPAPSLRAIRPDVSPALEAAYQKMMAKKPEDRPASMSELIMLLHASKPTSDDPAPAAPPAEPTLARMITDQKPPERGGPPRPTADSTIFARRAGGDAPSEHELSLRDLVTDVRSDVYGTGEAGADRDESKGSSDVRELSLRELAQEMEEEAHRASAPKPHVADAPPSKRTAAPRPDDAPPGAPASGADAPLPRRAPGPQQDAAPPVAPMPSAAEARPPRPAALPRQEHAPPVARREPPKPSAAMRPSDPAPNKGVGILALVTAIVLILAVIVSMARRPTGAEEGEGSPPAAGSVESEMPPP
jgi:serine/threonine protein kinase